MLTRVIVYLRQNFVQVTVIGVLLCVILWQHRRLQWNDYSNWHETQIAFIHEKDATNEVEWFLDKQKLGLTRSPFAFYKNGNAWIVRYYERNAGNKLEVGK